MTAVFISPLIYVCGGKENPNFEKLNIENKDNKWELCNICVCKRESGIALPCTTNKNKILLFGGVEGGLNYVEYDTKSNLISIPYYHQKGSEIKDSFTISKHVLYKGKNILSAISKKGSQYSINLDKMEFSISPINF